VLRIFPYPSLHINITLAKSVGKAGTFEPEARRDIVIGTLAKLDLPYICVIPVCGIDSAELNNKKSKKEISKKQVIKKKQEG